MKLTDSSLSESVTHDLSVKFHSLNYNQAFAKLNEIATSSHIYKGGHHLALHQFPLWYNGENPCIFRLVED